MSAYLVQVAECVLSDFTGAYALDRISQPIKAKRGLVPKFTPGQQPYGEYQVFVSPVKETSRRISRNTIEVDYFVEVVVCCRMKDAEKTTTDAGQLLLEDLSLLFFKYDLSNGFAYWKENDVFFWGDPERLAFDGAFFALWQTVLTGQRDKGQT